MTQQLTLAHRRIADQPPLVIAEIGIHREGSFERALAMPMVAVSAAAALALLFSGAWYFRRMEQTFADLV